MKVHESPWRVYDEDLDDDWENLEKSKKFSEHPGKSANALKNPSRPKGGAGSTDQVSEASQVPTNYLPMTIIPHTEIAYRTLDKLPPTTP